MNVKDTETSLDSGESAHDSVMHDAGEIRVTSLDGWMVCILDYVDYAAR